MNRRLSYFLVCRETDRWSSPDDRNGDGENVRPAASSSSHINVNRPLPSTSFPADMRQNPGESDPGETTSSVFPPHFNGFSGN